MARWKYISLGIISMNTLSSFKIFKLSAGRKSQPLVEILLDLNLWFRFSEPRFSEIAGSLDLVRKVQQFQQRLKCLQITTLWIKIWPPLKNLVSQGNLFGPNRSIWLKIILFGSTKCVNYVLLVRLYDLARQLQARNTFRVNFQKFYKYIKACRNFFYTPLKKIIGNTPARCV